MFDTVLVADRGPVAVHLLEALTALGLKAVTVHSDDDHAAAHVAAADEAVLLGDEGGYADIRRVVEAAQQSGAQAVHPGEGPLSADAAAADAVREAGLVWLLGGTGSVEDLQLVLSAASQS